MATLIKHINRVYAARSFLENVVDNVGDTLYIGLGRNASFPWPNELAPPVPANTKADDNAFWATLIGIGKVSNVNETYLAVPKVPWSTNGIYKAADDPTLDKSVYSAGNQFYVINSNDIVYSCAAVGAGGTGDSEPTHLSGTVAKTNFTWKFEYDAGAMGGWSTLNTLNWLPVPDGGSGTTPDFGIALGANNVIVGMIMPDYAGTGNKIPNEEYRQIALLKNPQTSGAADCTLDFYAPVDLENVGGDISDGILLALDNRVKITRAEGQTETVVSVLKF
jgi:hypothetical protein